MGQFYSETSRVELGEDSACILADADCFRTDAWTSPDDTWCSQERRRIDIYHSFDKIQNLTYRPPEPLSSRQTRLQVQVAQDYSICILLTDHTRQDGVAGRVGTSTGSSTRNRTEMSSVAHMPILFESLTDPIVSGREELGMPKLYSSIDVHRRAKGYRMNIGWEGAIWGNFSWDGLTEVDPATESGNVSGEDDDGILVYRYVPQVERSNKGEAEAEYPVFVPYKDDMPQPRPQRVYHASKARFKIDALDWEALPTLHHVISRLEEIPVYEIISGKVVEGVGVPDVGAAHRIE
jgi:hypothetical protein